MTNITLSGWRGKNKVALIDNEDLEKVKKYSWYLDITGYPKRSYRVNGKHKTQNLHRLIMGNIQKSVIDHINGNKLDNRKQNLRIVPRAINSGNHKRLTNNSSGYTGVFYRPHAKKWQAYTSINSKHKHIGYYSTAKEAHTAYLKFRKDYEDGLLLEMKKRS